MLRNPLTTRYLKMTLVVRIPALEFYPKKCALLRY